MLVLGGLKVSFIPVDHGKRLTRDEHEIVDDLQRSVQITRRHQVRDTILVHDLRPSELDVGRVHLLPEHLVDGLGTGKNNRLALYLHDTLAEPDEVRSNTDRPSSDHGDGKDVVIRPTCLSGDETGTAETLDTESVLETDDGGELVATLPVDFNLVGDDGSLSDLVELVQLFGGEVEIFKALFRLAGFSPGDVKERHDLVCETDAGARVGREVDTGETVLAGVLGGLVKVLILDGAERTDLVGDVVGDDDYATALAVLGSLHGKDPSDHTAGVEAGCPVDLDEVAILVEDQLGCGEEVGGDFDVGEVHHELAPGLFDSLTEEVGEVVDVGGTDDVGLVSTGLKGFFGRVGEVDGLKVELALFSDGL